MRVLCLGDVVGRPGRMALQSQQARLKSDYKYDFLLVNGENAAGGLGLSATTAEELHNCGVDAITLGDHTWKQKDAATLLNKFDYCIRPANYPNSAPGRGWAVFNLKSGGKVGVFNLLGRVFTGALVDCPFRKADELLAGPLKDCTIKICDFHAEASSEKNALAFYLDGRVSLVVGTHTHVQTADERISEKGTAAITDLGMCGSSAGIIGMEAEASLARLVTGLPASYKLAQGSPVLCGLICDIDHTSGKAVAVKRIRVECDE
ncbi:MAG: TIGR00282 family metallophosphoesterase [Deltaproteobacteria bacterium]|nr:TIGR00282 family metallophosphoesterase [Deltaproteobacteria bacterium]